jgi:two-component system, cell cycle sensor histidine kinase and response regulator CckA
MPKILIIDDLEENTSLIKEMLVGYIDTAEVHAAIGGRKGLELAQQLSPDLDLIILDANMPDLSGFEVCEKFKANLDNGFCPVLMLSAVFVNSKDRVRGLESGADGYLCKPYHMEELIAQVKVLLRIKDREDQLRANREQLTTALSTTSNQLEATEEQFSVMFDASPDAICVIDEDARILDVNLGAESLYGQSRTELIGSSMLDRFQQHLQEEFDKEFEVWLKSDHSTEWQSETSGTAYNQIPVAITARRFRYRNKKAILMNIRDISARMALENQLRWAQKMDAIGRLAGGIAHDFNNLLTSILGYSYLAKENLAAGNPEADIDHIIKAADRATRLTRQLLVFSRKQMLPLHPVKVNQVIEDVDHLLRRTIGENIELVTVMDEDLPYVKSDEGHIEQIIINLSVNAREAMPQGGKITLETVRSELKEDILWHGNTIPAGVYAALRVSDTGTGIPDEIMEKIFEPFFSTKGNTQAVGMGLAMVYGIVKHCKGYIEIQSSPENGTDVVVYFPETIIDSKWMRPKNDDDLPSGNETILLVEDEDLVRRLTKTVLSSLGYTVMEARHGEEALRIIRAKDDKIDLLISDMVMPQMGGPELLDALKCEGLDTFKVLFITGFSDGMDGASDAIGENILHKPYTRESLSRTIRAVLDETVESTTT